MIPLTTVNAVQMRGVTKTFGSVVANNKVDLDIRQGEILSLLGENGSGKTTLMNMLSGIYFPDEGEITVRGEKVTIRDPKDAFDLGIGMIHQHFKLVDVLSATENILLGLNEKGRLNLKEASEKIRRICAKYGFNVDPDKKIYDMSVSEKQTVEIVKVLYRGAEILILDEPTAVLTPQETRRLFDVMRNMRADGKSIIIITHKLHEVMEISDRVAVLRKGEYVGCIDTCDTNPQELTEMMVGHAVTLNIDRPDPVDPQLRVAVKNLTVRNEHGIKALNKATFEIYSGEILGIAGVAGSGQRELLEAIAGLHRADSGKIVYHKEDGTKKRLDTLDPQAIVEEGVMLSFVPEDRFGMGLVGSMNITDNIMLRSYRQGHGPLVEYKQPRKLSKKIVKELEVVTPDIDHTPISQLSGGNVQKVLVGREIAFEPSVLMSAYAVRGLDINTSYTIYNLLTEQKKKGVAVVYVGEDLDVLLELCDRILVLCAGHVNGIVDARTTTKEEVGLLMTNLQKNEKKEEVK